MSTVNVMSRPTVSVAMATYNGSQYLREQIDSILEQTYSISEIVVSDDNSRDATRDILLDYRNKFPGIFKILLNDSNVGFIKNFERAISACSEDYIALCDQDDVWDLSKIETLVTSIGSRDLIHSDARIVDAKLGIIAPSFTEYSQKRVREQSFTDLCVNNSVTGCTCMFKRSVLEKALPFPSHVPHDHWLAIVARDGKGIAYCPKPLVFYRQHGKNAIGAKDATGQRKVPTNKPRSRRDILSDKKTRYENMYACSKHALSERGSRKVKEVSDYYASYFTQKIRIKSFFFHLVHLSTFSNRKTVLQTIHALFFALYDRGSKD